MARTAYIAKHLFDGTSLRNDYAVVVDGTVVETVVPRGDLGVDVDVIDLGDGVIAPGFVDLQLNGGGGVMFNDDPCVETLRIMARAHLGIGSTSILPTLITDTPDKTAAAIHATIDAIRAGVAGIAGLHLEGPHLSRARKGAHDPDLIHPMTDEDLAQLLNAAAGLPSLMVTVAPESVTPDQISTLNSAGVIVSLGHTDADFTTCQQFVQAGASCVTHLFNAMSQIGNREPGLVGAALHNAALNAGLIADGVHVHPANIGTAIRAKQGPGEVFLVTDAMATAGSDIAEFTLNGRRISRSGGRLTLEDGTLAGADLELATALRVMTRDVGVSLETALGLATSAPARVLKRSDIGTLLAGGPADFVHLDAQLALKLVWQAGRAVTRDDKAA